MLQKPSPADAELTNRQREVLAGLEILFQEGFAELRMADIAERMGCSLRLLYGLADSRDALIATIVDRSLWRIGRAASESIQTNGDPVQTIIDYLVVANGALGQMSDEFAADLWRIPAARSLALEHEEYLVGRTRELIDAAIDQDRLEQTDSASLARVVAGMARALGDSERASTLTAQILGGLRRM